jgi:serine/threonine-protein kinase
MTVNEGDVLAGKYRVEKLLGVGGMGAVVAAHHLQLDERVAIKFLLPEALVVPEAVARFAREARAATKIKNEHVVRTIDVGTLETGAPYIVMEYLDGRDLSALIREVGPLSTDVAAEYLLQACEALAEAHALGIIHRDLKPSNLFLTKRMDGTPLVKVLDFGISKVTGTAGSGPDLGLTKTTAMMGSPLYMSPEQMSSARDVDTRTDIWALGTILYEILSGVPPFNADTVPQLCAMVLQQEHEALRMRRPDLPPAVDAIIARCLRKAPADRYPNVAEFAMALAELAPKHARASVRRISGIISTAGLSASALAMPPSSQDAVEDLQQARDATTGATALSGMGAATAAAWSETAPSIPKRSALPFLIAGGAVAALVGVVGVVFVARAVLGNADAAAELASSAEAAPVVPAEPVAPPVIEPVVAAPSASAAPVAKAERPASKPTGAKPAAVAKPAPADKPAPTPTKPTDKPSVAPPSPPAAVGLGGRT